MLTRTNLKTILTISVLQLYICSAGLADEIRDTIVIVPSCVVWGYRKMASLPM